MLAQQQSDGSWQVGIDGEAAFADLLAAAPSNLLTQDAQAILGANPAAEAASTVNYKFPWSAEQSWGWWQGWHTSAHDLGTTSTDRRVLAAADGVVSAVYTCALSAFVDLKHADGAVFRYLHLDKYSIDTGTVRVGARVPQGFVLGVVKPDTWEDGNCGYTTQSPGWAHVHWVMPTDRPFTIDGWTITFPTNAWRKDGVTKVPGYGTASTLPSTNTATIFPQPASSTLGQRVFVPVSR
jgi:murein DD-endopeptidase MepM/ murein hydrolase activator NlpD